MPEFQVRRGGAWVSVGGSSEQPVPDVTDLDPVDVGNVLGLAGYLAALEDVYSETIPYGQKVGQSHAPLTMPGAGTLVTVQRSLGPQDIVWLYRWSGYGPTLGDESTTNHRINLRALLAGANPQWEEKTPVAGAANAMGGAINGKLYLALGISYNPTSNVTATRQYDPATDLWVAVATASSNRRHGAKWKTDSAIGMSMGFQASNQNVGVSRYTPGGNIHNVVTLTSHPLSLGTYLAAAAFFGADGYVYVMGGKDSNGTPTNRFGRHLPTGSVWEPLANLPSTICEAGAGTDGTHIYLFGGNRGGAHLDEVRRYTPSSGTWVSMNPLPVGTSLLDVTYFAEANVFICSGGTSNDKQNDRVWVYDVANNTWEQVGLTLLPTYGGQQDLLTLAAS